MSDERQFSARQWLQSVLAKALIGGLLLLPYRLRVPLCGFIVSRVVGPLAGYNQRVRDNLAQVMPQLSQSEVKRIASAVPDNVGRTLIEIYSGQEFIDRATAFPLSGPGLAQLEQAKAAGRPVILATGHFGNYDAVRACLIAQGYPVGALYRPLNNAYLNTHYVRAISQIGEPVFPRGKKGMAAMLRFLRGGGMLGILHDQHMSHGEPLMFFGQEALTAVSAAELALKYDALLIPIYGVRQENRLDFKILVEQPIPHGDAVQMTQDLNDNLEKVVRENIDQWFWIHRRWKR